MGKRVYVPNRIDRVGGVYGRLTVVGFHSKTKKGEIKWECICICGNSAIVRSQNLVKGHTKSCGCFGRENPSHKKHGLRNHPLYLIWRSMLTRCYDKNSPSYRLYGAKGVTVCEEWKSDFKSFYDWCMTNGWQKGLQIDKDIIPYNLGIDVRKYCPSMCSIVTSAKNGCYRSSSRYLEFNGKKQTVSEWAKELGIQQNILNERLYLKWSVERALTQPVNKNKK